MFLELDEDLKFVNPNIVWDLYSKCFGKNYFVIFMIVG